MLLLYDYQQFIVYFLLFHCLLGTETYPEENAYSAYLNAHGGSSNAYTSQEDTVYYFDILNDYLEEVLNMFAAFFVCPLFTESATMREIHAVDNEHTKNLQVPFFFFFFFFFFFIFFFVFFFFLLYLLLRLLPLWKCSIMLKSIPALYALLFPFFAFSYCTSCYIILYSFSIMISIY